MSWINVPSPTIQAPQNNSSSMWWVPLAAAGISAIGDMISNNSNRQNSIDMAKLNYQQQSQLMQQQYRYNQRLQAEALANNNAAADTARQWQLKAAKQMFDYENAYNTPLAQMARLQEAGINPFVAASQYGTGMSQTGQINVPTASSPTPSPSASVGLGSASVPPIAPFNLSSSFSSIASGLSALASARKAGVETDQLEALFEDTAKQLRLQNVSIELQNQYQKTVNSIQSVMGLKQAKASYRKTIQEIGELASRQALNGEQIELTKVEALLKKAEEELTGEKKQQLIEQRPIILENLKKQGELIDAQKGAANASANASNAQADFYTAQKRKTISEAEYQESMNKVTTKANEIRGTVQGILRYVHKNPNMSTANKDALYKMADGLLEEIQALTPEYYKVHEEGSYTSEHMKLLQQQIKRAIKENDWFEVERLTNILTGIAGAAK